MIEEVKINEIQTIHAVLNGDRQAYEALVHAYHPHVRSACMAILLNRDEADDAAQDVFIKAYVALRQYRRDVSFGAWLHRIASNHCLDVLRKKKRQRTDSLDGLMSHDGEQGALEWPEPRETSAPGERREQTALALKALHSLAPGEREILVLREIEDMSYEDIGKALHCSLDAVKSRLRRARLRLQEKARHYLDEPSLSE